MASNLTLDSSAQKDDKEQADLESALTRTVLNLEEIDKGLYRGTHLWKPIGGRGVFGGQVVGQALTASRHTVPKGLHVHSLHCYFLIAGKDDRPILYHVQSTRDGDSFSARTVHAVQNGETILSMLVSYHKVEESELVHQYKFPDVPPPDGLLTTSDLMQQILSLDNISDKVKARINRMLAQEVPIEMKPVDPQHYMESRLATRRVSEKPKRFFWVKAKGYIGEQNMNIHRCVLAYISDYAFLGVALYPFPMFRPQMMASLDHSMWFHSVFRADEWMLFECESPRSVGARSLVLGRFWKQDGTLAVSVAQEGVIRGYMHKPKL